MIALCNLLEPAITTTALNSPTSRGQPYPNLSALYAGMAAFVWILAASIGSPLILAAEPSRQDIDNIRAENRIPDGRPDSLAAQGLVDPGNSTTVSATREFEIRDDRAYLAGHPIEIWGLRCGNALHSAVITERHIRNLDNMAAHGINCLGVYIQGSNGGWPDPGAALNGFTRDGRLKGSVADRLERLIRAADQRGMVVMVGLFSHRKDQDFYDDAAIRRAVEEAARFLSERKLKNVFVDICHEFSHPSGMDQALLREPDGVAKKAKLTAWFKAVAPDIEVGICPDIDSGTGDSYPNMEVRIIQKEMPIPAEGFVVNVETRRQDVYQNDGIFNDSARAYVIADCQRYLAARNAAMLFHAAFIQGITNYSGSAPHPEMGGYGTDSSDRGVRFYYEWVRDHAGRWEYPKHVPVETDRGNKHGTPRIHAR